MSASVNAAYEIIKERRARQLSRPESSFEQVTENDFGTLPTVQRQRSQVSESVDEAYESSQEASPTGKTKPFSPRNDSKTVSTCPTYDEITIDTTRTTDSTKKSRNSPTEYLSPLSPPSISNESRKGNIRNNNPLKLQRLLCISSKEKVDTSFSQIDNTICNTTLNSTSNDDVVRRSSEKTTPNRFSSKFSFHALNNHDDADEYVDSQDELPNTSMNHSKDSQSQKRGVFVPKSLRSFKTRKGKEKNRQTQNQEINETDSISTTSRRKGSSLFRSQKDAWYLRPTNDGENGGELECENGEVDNEVLDRLMHAVVFVTKN